MEYVKAKAISLKAHEVYSEKWLQERLADDPGLLGLGDLVVKDVNVASHGPVGSTCY